MKIRTDNDWEEEELTDVNIRLDGSDDHYWLVNTPHVEYAEAQEFAAAMAAEEIDVSEVVRDFFAEEVTR